ncbi:MAG: MarR family transcriptional regulator [Microbacterium sp.]|nr:MarR family transcriptional regulator [Microbacterium sp.]
MTSDDTLSPVDALAQLAFLVHGVLERRATEADLSISQMRLLGILRDREPTMNELGARMVLDKSSISGLVDRAERRGLVVRVPSSTDRRSVRVRMTDAGRELTHRVERGFDADVLALLAGISPAQQSALVSGATALISAEARARAALADAG